MPAGSGRYPSGQRGQTVNLLAYAFGGSNPPLPTIHAGGNSSAVERQPSKLGVAGSNPVSRSIVTGAACSVPIEGGLSAMRVAAIADAARDIDNRRAHVAQLAEHALGKGEVSGSIPDMGSRFFSPTNSADGR
jgi:hypothetical protein